MGMAEDELVGLRIANIGEIKIIRFGTYLCIEEHMHQHVAQLLADVVGVVFHECVAKFKRFLYGIGAQALVGLLLVPRALLAQLVENVHEPAKRL